MSAGENDGWPLFIQPNPIYYKLNNGEEPTNEDHRLGLGGCRVARLYIDFICAVLAGYVCAEHLLQHGQHCLSVRDANPGRSQRTQHRFATILLSSRQLSGGSTVVYTGPPANVRASSSANRVHAYGPASMRLQRPSRPLPGWCPRPSQGADKARQDARAFAPT